MAARWARAGVLLAAALSLLAGAAGFIGALAYDRVRQGLPAVEQIESLFDPAQAAAYRSTRFYDRTGRILLQEISNPPLPTSLPDSLEHAVVAFIDPSFWTNPGYDAAWLAEAVRQGLRGQAVDPPPSITQRLVRNTLLPPGEQNLPLWLRALREAMLAAELTTRYSKTQILQWYLSSAPVGRAAYGVEAGARRYLGKSAAGLTLGESALLAAVLDDPSLNPWEMPQQAKARQAQVLQAMQAAGWIEAEAAQAAVASPLALLPDEREEAPAGEAFAMAAQEQLQEVLGPGYVHRGGLRVITTLDYDLQLQAECLAQTQVLRLSGENPGTIAPASDGSACVSASLLPPLRPGDADVDHRLTGAAVAVLDPGSGEVLSLVLPTGAELPSAVRGQAGISLYPFVYLTAFASGYTPASMVLDIPTTLRDADGGVFAPQDDDGVFHGPVRMRTALANAYPLPAARTLQQMGVGAVLRIARQMGLTTLEGPDAPRDVEGLLEDAQVDLLDLVYAYGVMANGGVMVGVPIGGGVAGGRGLDPALVLRVEDAAGRAVYDYRPDQRVVLSRQLAYLMVNVLSDETARWETLGRSNVLEVGRPAGAMIGVASELRDNWTVGFTPNLAVAAWVGSRDGEVMQGVRALNGAAPLWNAVLRYATRDRARAGWAPPLGIGQVEVCDPSGLLPTEYCPTVVREVFIQGTEPTHYDTLYQPFRVNRETGKLATLFTPLALVEERVYLVPPPEATDWARQAGIEQPPQEYDTLYAPPFNPDVNITAPESFTLVRGVVEVRGNVRPQDLDYFRLQYGQGLNPDRWVQIGDDTSRPVHSGKLGVWDTSGLNGLYTLQLLAVLEDGRVETTAVQVTVDNQPPEVHLVLPQPGQVFSWPADEQVVIQADVSDEVGIDRVEFFVDSQGVAAASMPPYSMRWELGRAGEHVVFVRAYDTAGNRADSERVRIRVVR